MRDGLVSGGLRRWFGVRTLAVLLAFAAVACGSGDGKHRAVECHADADCDDSELGVCDVATCVENRCELESRPDGHRCDDSDPLTGEDACVSGICAGVVKECDDDLGPCLKAVYDADSDECVVEPVDDGAPCDDEDACTAVDTCQAGECLGDEPKTCEATDACHVAGECDPKSGECEPAPAPDGEPCDDGEACTSDDACQAGACQGKAVVCDDGLACSVDSCDEMSGGCAADMKGCTCVLDRDCDDGNACNGTETCDPSAKLCQAGAAVVCPSSRDACLSNECVPETGACEPVPVVDGVSCDDGNACTRSDTCQDGACSGGDAVVCGALSQCHAAGICQPETGECTNPELKRGTSCNDGNACTKVDTCAAGACLGASPTTCSASDQCHDVGACNVKTGACSNPAKSNGVSCDDKNRCTTGDSCQAGKCAPSGQVACAAKDSCHEVGTCDVATGLCSDPVKADGASCNDGSICTGTDVCAGGKCGGAKVVCDDKIGCTVDTCSEAQGGCVVDSKACACKTSADCNDGNPCNGVETCDLGSLQCKPGTAVDCSSLNDECNVGVCSVQTGTCQASPKAAGTACDDKNACTGASSCVAGICQGTDPVVCTADQCHDLGTCNPSTGKCSTPVKANGTACSDGNACTQTDTCQGGVCAGAGATVCTAKSQCHDIGTCDPGTGRCSEPVKKNNTACSDGDKCTQTDTCQGGICVGSSSVVCVASDQCHSVGKCDSSTGACSNPAQDDGTACNDKSVCTRTDTCQKGVCTGASPVTCAALDDCHVAGSCDAVSGCSNPTKKDGSSCSDKDACTQTDACAAGKCVGASPVVCAALDDCHGVGTCDASKGTCSQPLLADGTPCSDGKACTSTDKCAKGVCGGATVACDDKIACTVDSCVEPGGCNYDHGKCGCAKDADCNDGNACNGVETCDLQTLSCKSGTAVSCSKLDDACNVGVCDRTTGACKAAPVTDGTACNDGSACTQSDSCSAGKCVGAKPVVCKAADDCHDIGTCDPSTGACSTPTKVDGTTCSDGDACTLSDACKTGKCVGAAKKCTALDQCHDVGVCDSKTGACSNPNRTGSCDDKDACTQVDTCLNGSCVGGSLVKCSASDQCHDVGVCDTKTGVCSNPNKPDGNDCTDNDLCTRTDACKSGKCVGSNPVVCDAPRTCFALGVCDPKTAICSTPFANAGAACSDADACTSGEACDGKGACAGGSTVTCTPSSNLCQVNVCNVTSGCAPVDQPPTTPCDDANECTQTDTCAKGVCRGGDRRANVEGDWADDPGARSAGPTSVDIFTDKSGNAHVTGTYVGTVAFNDKDEPKTATALALPEKLTVGIYWTTYTELGAVARAVNIGGSSGTLKVSHAAGHRDGTFSLIGSFTGTGLFGLSGGKTRSVSVKTETIFVSHYAATGDLVWLAQFTPAEQVAFTATSVAAFDDGSVVAVGTVGGSIVFRDAAAKVIASDERTGAWAVRLDADGFGKWAELVVLPGGTVTTQAVATHPESYTLPDKSVVDDGGATLTGRFTGEAKLGPNGEVGVAVSTAEGRIGGDVWFLKLDRNGKLRWGGRVGGTGADVAGDVVRGALGGALLLANTLGGEPSANDAKTTQALRVVSSGSFLQAHVLGLDSDGVLVSDGLIANAEGVTRGHQLKLDARGFYAVAGNFANATSFYGAVGFGSGPPKNAAQFTIASLYQGPATLFLGRVDASSKFAWAVQAGGDTSGMLSGTGWDIVMTAHPSHSASVAGMFNAESYFGDRVPELLQAAPGVLGNPFVVHLNSEAEYDYCK